MRRVVDPSGKRIEFLARAVVNRLEDRGLVEFRDAEAAITLFARALEENFAAAGEIEKEARGKLGTRATDEQVEREMRRIAEKRNFIL